MQFGLLQGCKNLDTVSKTKRVIEHIQREMAAVDSRTELNEEYKDQPGTWPRRKMSKGMALQPVKNQTGPTNRFSQQPKLVHLGGKKVIDSLL